jgi:hypothetical protein
VKITSVVCSHLQRRTVVGCPTLLACVLTAEIKKLSPLSARNVQGLSAKMPLRRSDELTNAHKLLLSSESDSPKSRSARATFSEWRKPQTLVYLVDQRVYHWPGTWHVLFLWRILQEEEILAQSCLYTS